MTYGATDDGNLHVMFFLTTWYLVFRKL